MNTDLLELDRIRKNISIGYFYAIIAIFIIFSGYYWSESIGPFKYIMAVGLFFHCFCFFVPLMLSYNVFRPLVTVYLFSISVIVYPLVLLFWQLGQITTFLWFFLIPTASMIFYSVRAVMFWSIYIFVLICSVFLVSLFFPDLLAISVTSKQISTINILTIICFLALFFYFLYCMNIINQVKIRKSNSLGSDTVIIENSHTEQDIEKLNKLYDNITTYLHKKKPYCDPDFTISQLSEAIDSNITYISKAIKLNKDVNFNIFINSYRIDMVKEMLNNDYQNKYTMRYIYTSSGFRHQSTFNKVFKQISGVTPSEYIKKLEFDRHKGEKAALD